MNVSKFIESFVFHNSEIRLYELNHNVGEDNHYTEGKLLWSGMDWQCNDNKEDQEYCKSRGIEVCPYNKAHVYQITRLYHPVENIADVIDLVIKWSYYDPIKDKTTKGDIYYE